MAAVMVWDFLSLVEMRWQKRKQCGGDPEKIFSGDGVES